MTDRDELVDAVGVEDAEAVRRLLDGLPLCVLFEFADAHGQDWPDWARAAAILQRWTEAKGVAANLEHKLGYLSCAAEGSKATPTSMRPRLSQAVEEFLSIHGFDPSSPN